MVGETDGGTDGAGEKKTSAGAGSRRRLIAGGLAGAAALVTGGLYWRSTLPSLSGGGLLSPDEAHTRASAGEILLIDIRRPDEWAETGLGTSARPLDMRVPDFATQLLEIAGGDPSAPVALICARGVRSRHVTAALREAGFTQIYDVPEGMLGSVAGPGWLERGLPVMPWAA